MTTTLTVPRADVLRLHPCRGRCYEANGCALTLWANTDRQDRYHTTEVFGDTPLFGDPEWAAATLIGNLHLGPSSVRRLLAEGRLEVRTPFGTLALQTEPEAL